LQRKVQRVKKSLKDKRILHGITGSIAAYKAVDLLRRMKEEGASVTPVMTDASMRFLAPLSLEAASGNKAYSGLFEDPMAHITLTRDADLMLVAPATANSIGKFANGIADDMLSTCFLSFRGRVVLAPAMNWRMYESPVFRRNLDYLKALGVTEVPPEKGPLACGEEGVGRMAAVEGILEAVRTAVTEADLSGRKIVVTAGPTREYIDAVRFISNRSSGKMGYALARVARRRGAEVALISGPSSLEPPPGVRFIPVGSASEMRSAVMKELKGASALIMAAAVTDFSPGARSADKLEKASLKSLALEATPDILKEAGGRRNRPLLVGFAAEAGDRRERAKKKLLEKGADIIVFNDITEPAGGFEADTNRIVIIEKDGEAAFPLLTKEEAAQAILDRVSGILKGIKG
jgi:phosphopantothenoylcysteine decarboxylase/phosphopantothenate--cysteine ligase